MYLHIYLQHPQKQLIRRHNIGVRTKTHNVHRSTCAATHRECKLRPHCNYIYSSLAVCYKKQVSAQ